MIEFDMDESNEKNDDLIVLLSCHCVGHIDFTRGEDEVSTIITVKYNGKSSSHSVSSDTHNPSKRRTASALLYQSESDFDDVYMLLSIQHKGLENINFVRMNDSLYDLLFKKYIKLK